jgi:hypothetical protein
MKPSLHLKRNLKNQSGQIAVEYILIMVVFVGLFISVKNILISNNSIGAFVQKPWALVAGMIESGVWEDPKKARASHPGLLSRHRTLLGERE